MWVPNCVDEWNTVRNHTTLTRHTWLGGRARDAKPCSSASLDWSRGQVAMNERDLPWMIDAGNHGLVGESKCIAYVNRHGDVSDHVHYYMCDSPKYHVICEKNSTIPVAMPMSELCNLCKETTGKKTTTVTKTDGTKPDSTVTETVTKTKGTKPDTTVKKTETVTKTEETKPETTTTMATTTTIAATTTIATTTTMATNETTKI